MKKSNFSFNMMMGMCMQLCCMCVISCAEKSDVFSVSKVNQYTV